MGAHRTGHARSSVGQGEPPALGEAQRRERGDLVRVRVRVGVGVGVRVGLRVRVRVGVGVGARVG